MLAFHVDISDELTPHLRRAQAALWNPRGLVTVCGKEMEIRIRKHFMTLDARPNARGWPKKHFWRDVARNTAMTLSSDSEAVVSVASPEYAHRIIGGTITAKRAKALSIPLSPEAYRAGSASLFPAQLTMISRKGRPPLLVETGRIGRSKAWKIHYVLLKSVTHEPHRQDEPDLIAIEGAVRSRARAYLDRIFGGQGTATA